MNTILQFVTHTACFSQGDGEPGSNASGWFCLIRKTEKSRQSSVKTDESPSRSAR